MEQRGRKGDGVRGAALVEAAFVLPVALALILGTIEFGLAFQTRHSLSDLGANAAREAAIWGDEPLSDRAVLDTIAERLDSIDRDAIDVIVVYRSVDGAGRPSPDGAMPAGCSFASIDDVCNRYAVADLDRPDTDFGCGVGTIDDAWCPADREADIASGAIDYVGVHIGYDHPMATGLYGRELRFDESAVARIEPRRPE